MTAASIHKRRKRLLVLRGVYTITCAKALKAYVGRSEDINSRIEQHFAGLRNGVHHSAQMQRDFNIYGEEEFTCDVHQLTSDLEHAKAIEGVLIQRAIEEGTSYNAVVHGRFLPSKVVRTEFAGKKGIDAVIARIRLFRREMKIPRSRLATMAGIFENALRKIDDEGWNPTARTIAKLEVLIPEDYNSFATAAA